ncbi:hypothetical protein CAPTEDRAFT_106033, partial [Capitella teleta]
ECNFDEGLCDLKQELDDDVDWTRLDAGTPSKYTGPTAGQGGSGWFLYLEATDRAIADTARLSNSNTFTFKSTLCIDFFYHMYGKHMGTLKVILLDRTSQEHVVWQRTGNQGITWLHQLITYSTCYLFVKIVWEVTRGNGYRSDFALDTISVTDGPCQDDSSRVTVNPPEGKVLTVNQEPIINMHSEELEALQNQ